MTALLKLALIISSLFNAAAHDASYHCTSNSRCENTGQGLRCSDNASLPTSMYADSTELNSAGCVHLQTQPHTMKTYHRLISHDAAAHTTCTVYITPGDYPYITKDSQEDSFATNTQLQVFSQDKSGNPNGLSNSVTLTHCSQKCTARLIDPTLRFSKRLHLFCNGDKTTHRKNPFKCNPNQR